MKKTASLGQFRGDMNRDKIKEIVMEILIENEQYLSPRSGRDLFWYALKGVISVWIYMLNTDPLASVWWAGGRWNYSIPVCNIIGDEEFREDAMHRVETHLAGSERHYIEELG